MRSFLPINKDFGFIVALFSLCVMHKAAILRAERRSNVWEFLPTPYFLIPLQKTGACFRLSSYLHPWQIYTWDTDLYHCIHFLYIAKIHRCPTLVISRFPDNPWKTYLLHVDYHQFQDQGSKIHNYYLDDISRKRKRLLCKTGNFR